MELFLASSFVVIDDGIIKRMGAFVRVPCIYLVGDVPSRLDGWSAERVHIRLGIELFVKRKWEWYETRPWYRNESVDSQLAIGWWVFGFIILLYISLSSCTVLLEY